MSGTDYDVLRSRETADFALGPPVDEEPLPVSDDECRRCGCALDLDGYCTDEFCPYSTRLQEER